VVTLLSGSKQPFRQLYLFMGDIDMENRDVIVTTGAANAYPICCFDVYIPQRAFACNAC
jgi:hypothetical protein